MGVALDVAKILANLPAWLPASYHVKRGNLEFDVRKVVVSEVPLDRAIMYQYLVGSAYLVIGLFVYFRRGSAQKARHFYVLCLASFIFLCFHYTGQLNSFDKVIYFGNVVAGLVAPTVFLHFCLTFPEPRAWFRTARPARSCSTCPALLLFLVYLGFASGALKIGDAAGRIALDAGPHLGGVLRRVPYLIGGLVRQRWNTAGPKTRSCASSSSGCATARSAASCPSPCSTCCRTPWARFPTST